jgi:3-methyladenine DNA glycosylase AlkD
MASPQRSRSNASYFKTGPGQYGEGDRFAGLTVPQVRTLARKYRELGIDDTTTLLRSPVHEERLLALMVLVAQYGRGDGATRERIYKLYLANIAYVNNWDLVDSSAAQIVGAHLDGRSKRLLLDRLAASRSVWERRIAVLATFHDIRQGDPEPAVRIAVALLDDRHDLIHKAIGWMLRELGKRCGREHLTGFLDQHAATMPRTTLRYALENFDAKERARYMGMRAAARSTPP